MCLSTLGGSTRQSWRKRRDRRLRSCSSGKRKRGRRFLRDDVFERKSLDRRWCGKRVTRSPTSPTTKKEKRHRPRGREKRANSARRPRHLPASVPVSGEGRGTPASSLRPGRSPDLDFLPYRREKKRILILHSSEGVVEGKIERTAGSALRGAFLHWSKGSGGKRGGPRTTSSVWSREEKKKEIIKTRRRQRFAEVERGEKAAPYAVVGAGKEERLWGCSICSSKRKGKKRGQDPARSSRRGRVSPLPDLHLLLP